MTDLRPRTLKVAQAASERYKLAKTFISGKKIRCSELIGDLNIEDGIFLLLDFENLT